MGNEQEKPMTYRDGLFEATMRVIDHPAVSKGGLRFEVADFIEENDGGGLSLRPTVRRWDRFAQDSLDLLARRIAELPGAEPIDPEEDPVEPVLKAIGILGTETNGYHPENLESSAKPEEHKGQRIKATTFSEPGQTKKKKEEGKSQGKPFSAKTARLEEKHKRSGRHTKPRTYTKGPGRWGKDKV